MLTLQYLRQNSEDAIERLKKKGFEAQGIIRKVLDADTFRRQTQHELDALTAEAKVLAKQIGEFIREGLHNEAQEVKKQTAQMKERQKELQEGMKESELRIEELLLQIPNVPHEKVPHGKTPEDNVEVNKGGRMPELAADALPHWELAAQYRLIDFELGNKIAGAGFPVYCGQGAKLQRALIQFFLDRATAAGYTEIQPPILINADSGRGTGQLPDKDGQMYFVPLDGLYLAPTAEVPVTNMYRDSIVNESDMPIKMTAYTPCFRREAGSYGAHVRGLNRLHQFDKVEIVQLAHPDRSYEILEQMCAYVEGLLNELELPWRRIILCGGDMSFASALTYDFEVFSAAQKKWLEVSSVSNFESFQANRMKFRYKDAEGNHLGHTLNGSALALPRIVAALLENNQGRDGGIGLPKALHAYFGGEKIRLS